MTILLIGGLVIGALLLSRPGLISNLATTIGQSTSGFGGTTAAGNMPVNPLPDSSVLDTIGGNPNVGVTGVPDAAYLKNFTTAGSTGIAAATGHLGIAFSNPISGAIAGVALVAIIGVELWKAHELRKKQATNENQAVNAAIVQVDQVIRNTFAALNAHQILPADAIVLLSQGWAMYWDQVGRFIQPGRNGCQNGTKIPHFVGASAIDPNTYHGCSGTISSWGAACCVGSTIKASLANCIFAIRNPGQPGKVHTLYPDPRYGGTGRPGYVVQFNG